MEPTLHFFSLQIGKPGSRRYEWTWLDLKIPAYNVKQAITIYFWICDFRNKTLNKSQPVRRNFFTPPKIWVNEYVRQVVEFEKKETTLSYLIQYRKLKAHNVHEFIRFFET